MSVRSVRRSRRSLRRAVLAAFACVLVSLSTVVAPSVFEPAPAAASVNPTNQAVRGLQTWYVYVAPGEEPLVQFHKITSPTTGGWGPNTSIVVRDPRNTIQHSCVINSSTTIASTLVPACSFAPLSISASQAGVWSVAIEQGANPTTPSQTLGQNRLTWTIGAHTDLFSAVKPGRVWTESYVTTDDILDFEAGRLVNMTLFYQSRAGFTYRVARLGMLGIDAAFSANAFGVVDPVTCASVYESISFHGPTTHRRVESTACPFSPYKIFFESPASDLPASATLPGGTTTWLRVPPPTAEQIDVDLAFVPSAPGARSGRIEFTVANVEGTLDVLVDVDDDGVFTGPADRRLPAAAVTGRTTTVAFDGLTAQGVPISPTTPLAVQVAVDHLGEIHFLDSDVELLPNGVLVERMNGPAADRFALSWNDSGILAGLPLGEQKCSATTEVVGDEVGSSNGVHRWGLGTCTTAGSAAPRFYNSNPTQAMASGFAGTWGNLSDIDRWASVSAQRSFAFEIPAFEIAKTSDPAPGTPLAPGQTVDYTVTATPIRYSMPPRATAESEWMPATTWSGRWSDALASVVDDAEIDWSAIAADPGAGSSITTDAAGAAFTWTGEGIPIARSVGIRYAATVNDVPAPGGDRHLENIAYVHTEITPPGPPAQCAPRVCGTTSHPLGTGDLVLDKRDAEDGSLLAGAVFQLWRDVDRNGALDTAVDAVEGAPAATDATGRAWWRGLAWGSYLVQEVAPPVGYELVGTGVSAVSLVAAEEHIDVENPRLPGSAGWSKTDDSGMPLVGSEWSLQREDEVPIVVVDCVASPCTVADVDPAPGELRVVELDWGTYALRETRAPAGFVLDETVRTFSVSAVSRDIDLGEIVNRRHPPLVLPFTGGSAADAFALAGIGGGALALFAWLARAGRRRGVRS